MAETISCAMAAESTQTNKMSGNGAAEHLLDRAAEHVQREHVERQMHQAAVQERVGQQLPGRERHLGR